MPLRPAGLAGEGRRVENGTGSALTAGSAGIAAQGMAQDIDGICFADPSTGLLAQSIAAATGTAAIAIVSHSGPSRTSSIIASITNTALRIICETGMRRSVTELTRYVQISETPWFTPASALLLAAARFNH